MSRTVNSKKSREEQRPSQLWMKSDRPEKPQRTRRNPNNQEQRRIHQSQPTRRRPLFSKEQLSRDVGIAAYVATNQPVDTGETDTGDGQEPEIEEEQREPEGRREEEPVQPEHTRVDELKCMCNVAHPWYIRLTRSHTIAENRHDIHPHQTLTSSGMCRER